VQTYKEGHGVVVRRTAFVVLSALAVWGAMTLYDALSGFSFVKNSRLIEYKIPVINQYPDAAFFICWAVAGLAIWRIHKLLSREKTADYLIETDVEFRKVTWPSWKDAVTSALVVLLFVVAMTVYIALCDGALSFILGKVL
jgi:preprotein translocase SecE subunit